MNKSLKDFVENIKYVYPEEIAPENETKAYKNLRNENPNKSEKKSQTESSNSEIEKESSSSSFTPLENISRKQNEIIFSSDDNEKKKEKGRFGQHENFSFFESFSREMIFQIFNYHQMYFFNYDITYTDRIGDNNKIVEQENNIIENEQNPKNINIFNINKGKEQEEEQDKNEVQNGQNNIENKKEEIDVKNKLEENKNKKGKCKSDNEIKKSKNSTKKKKVKVNFKSDNDRKNKSKNKISFKGDIDLLIPNVKPDFLDKVLHKKELAPFIFFNNISFNLNSDIIGEIKESVLSGDKKHIYQLRKYLKIIERCKNDSELCNKLGLKKDNQKILLYVFNSDYEKYLERMLIYNPLSVKFKELNDNSNQVNDLCDLYSKSYLKELYSSKRKYDFIGEIINSNVPYIFIFIQNIFTLYSSINKTGKEKINNLFEKDKKFIEINEKENKNMDNRMIEINTSNVDKNKKIISLDSDEIKNQDAKNKDIKETKESEILKDGEKAQQINLIRDIPEQIKNKEDRILKDKDINDIKDIMAPISHDIKEMKELLSSLNKNLTYFFIFMIFFMIIFMIIFAFIQIFFK